MAKPLYLYHASPEANLKIIEPRRKTAPEGFNMGPVIFATDSFPFATQFLVDHDDSWANGGAFGDTFFFVIGDKKRFLKNDNGGTIYVVPSETFEPFNKREWCGKEKVKPVSRMSFSSGLNAMIITGVQVYFVKPQIYRQIQNSEDHGVSILNNLKSENEKWGLEVKVLELYKSSKKVV